jgi:hypothetical protein
LGHRHEPPQHKQLFFFFFEKTKERKMLQPLPLSSAYHQGSVCIRDTRHRLQEGNDASGAIDAVPRRDGFSPISFMTQEMAGATSPTTMVLLVSHCTVTSNNATTAMLENAEQTVVGHTTMVPPTHRYAKHRHRHELKPSCNITQPS